MSKFSIKDTTLRGIADAIREKDGTTDEILVSDMATKIKNISTTEEKPYIDTSTISDWSYYNYNGTRSETFKNLDTSNGRNFNRMCYNANNLVLGGELFCEKAEDLQYAFHSCSNMTDLILHLNSAKTSIMANAFINAYSLTNLTIYGTIKVDSNNLNLAYSNLSTESLTTVVNAFESNAEEAETYTVYFGSKNIAKLTDEQTQTVTAKNIKLT